MKEYTLFWLTGDSEIVRGHSISDAFSSCYSAGAIKALDFWSEGDDRKKWRYNKPQRNWEPC